MKILCYLSIGNILHENLKYPFQRPLKIGIIKVSKCGVILGSSVSTELEPLLHCPIPQLISESLESYRSMCDAPDSVDGRAPAPDPDTSSELTFNIPTMYDNQQKFCTKKSANM